MTATLNTATPLITLTGPVINARCEPVFLRSLEFSLTAREVVYCLAAHLTYFGDTLDPKIVDPLHAIDSHMRHDGNLTDWAAGHTTDEVAGLLDRAEQIARNYFGTGFPTITWTATQQRAA